jgi:fatty acid desaturase
MQVESANDFEVPRVVSILCGALDRQIEHHLFPRWPTNRLREVAPEIKAICERHGVQYRTDTWPGMLRRVFTQLRRLAATPRPQS